MVQQCSTQARVWVVPSRGWVSPYNYDASCRGAQPFENHGPAGSGRACTKLLCLLFVSVVLHMALISGSPHTNQRLKFEREKSTMLASSFSVCQPWVDMNKPTTTTESFLRWGAQHTTTTAFFLRTIHRIIAYLLRLYSLFT